MTVDLLVVDDLHKRMALNLVLEPRLSKTFDSFEYAESAREAKEKLEQRSYSAILSDVDMEEKGIGIEFAKYVKKNYDTPIILYSGNSEHRKQAEAIGVEFYEKNDLFEVINRLKELGNGGNENDK